MIAATLVMPLATLPLNGCLLALRPPGPPSERDSLVARQLLNLTLNAYWQAAMRNRPGLAVAVGDAPAMLPWLGEATARRNAQLAMRLQPALAEVDVEALSPRHYLLLQALDRELEARAASYTFYDLDLSVLSPRATQLRTVVETLLNYPLNSSDQVSTYLALLEGTGQWVGEIRGSLEIREARGVVASREVADAFGSYLLRFRDMVARGSLNLESARISQFDSSSQQAIKTRERDAIENKIVPAVDSLLAWLNGTYLQIASRNIGLWQYAGGKEYYSQLLRRYSGLEIEPQEAHEIGLEELQRIDSLLSVVQAGARLNPDRASLHDSLRGVVASRRGKSDSTIARLRRSQSLIAEPITDLISELPEPPRLLIASQLEEWLYPDGRVEWPDSASLTPTVLMTSAWDDSDAVLEGPGFAYRWLWPGAALAAALAARNDTLSFVRFHPSPAAVAGWSEYAASAAGELGLYADPMDSYGRLLHEGFNAALLVIDTGIHYFGWTKAQALAFLTPWSLADQGTLEKIISERVIATPGSAGVATLGAREFAAMRAWMQESLGGMFKLPAWHSELLSLGPAPLPALATYFEWWEWNERNKAMTPAADTATIK